MSTSLAPQSNGMQRLVFLMFGVVAMISVIGIILLTALGRTIPQELNSLVSSLSGVVVGLLVRGPTT